MLEIYSLVVHVRCPRPIEITPETVVVFPRRPSAFQAYESGDQLPAKTFWPVIIIERWVYRRVCVYIAIHDSITTIMVSAFLIGWPAVYHTESNRKKVTTN